jgi:pilus assembly protein CpaE
VALKIIIAGDGEKDIEAAVRACGATATVQPVSALASLAQTEKVPADILLIDIRGQASVPLALTSFHRQHPGVGILVVATAPDPDLMVSAMRAGANEWVAEPIAQGDLDAAITRIVVRQSPAPTNQTFAFVGVKGGVGATVVAVNVATALARIARSGTLMIDLQMSRGDAALYLGAIPRFSVADAFDNIQKLDEAFFGSLVVRAASRLDVLAAPEAGSATRLDPSRVKALLEFVSKQFEYVVIDVPRTDAGAMDALDGVKSIVLVTTQELPAVRSAASLSARLRQRYGNDRVLVVMNRLDKQSEISLQDVETALGGPVAFSFPNDYRAAVATLNTGRPLVLDDHGALAASFEKFARKAAGVQIQQKDKGARGGWLDRFVGRK